MPRNASRGGDAEAYHITVSWHLPESWRAAALLENAARLTLEAERIRTAQLSIAVVTDATMRKLHKRYCGVPVTTDVLTFDLAESPESRRGRGIEAEIVVCADVARREAWRRTGRGNRLQWLATARAELALYVVHGVLHLCGYDDHRARDFARMHDREDEILEALGLGAVFSAGTGARRNPPFS